MNKAEDVTRLSSWEWGCLPGCQRWDKRKDFRVGSESQVKALMSMGYGLSWKGFGSFRIYLFLLPHTGGCGSIRDQKERQLHSPERCVVASSPRDSTQLLDRPLWSKGQRISLVGERGWATCGSQVFLWTQSSSSALEFPTGDQSQTVTNGDFFFS